MLRPARTQWAWKTTTVEILEGLNQPSSGEVEVLGLRWQDHEKQIRERIGVTLQETRFPDKQTVREMTRLFRSFYREDSSRTTCWLVFRSKESERVRRATLGRTAATVGRRDRAGGRPRTPLPR